ncbi:Uncharacterised protein [uncultured archaeon]|nr:Uncharacterised protein [uncultured archaeon]
MKAKPLLHNELTPQKQAALTAMMAMPGWLVVEELHMAACSQATKDLLAADPTEQGYDQKVKALQLRSRERNEFSLLILMSVAYHAKALAAVEEEAKEEKPKVNPIIKPLYDTSTVQRNKS